MRCIYVCISLYLFFIFVLFLVYLGFKEFYVRPANSRGALTPCMFTGHSAVRLNRFTVLSRSSVGGGMGGDVTAVGVVFMRGGRA